MTTPTIAVKESLDDLKGIGPSTGISGFKLVYVIGKGLYQYKTGDQSGNVGTDTWVAPAEDTSGKSGAWNRIERTGLDENVVSGTAGTDGNLGQWNTDGDLVDSGVAGSDVLVKPGSSSSINLSFGSWRTPDANRPVLVTTEILVQSDGTSNGIVVIDVDEGGGTTADYSFQLFADSDAGSITITPVQTIVVPAGGSYQIRNTSDPDNANNIRVHREFTP